MTTQAQPAPGHLDVPDAVDTPTLLLDLPPFRRNMQAMHEVCHQHGVELMPHAKTHRVPELGVRQVALGADGLTVAKLGEGEAFADAGVQRLIVAYPVIGAAKLARAVALARRVDLTLAVDSLEGARAMGAAFGEAGLVAEAFLIVDSGLGRVGVSSDQAGEVGAAIAAVDGVRLTGVMTHEGTVYGARDREELVALSVATAGLMVGAAEAIRARGVDLSVVSMGASASAHVAATVPGVTQVRPGIFAFNDLGQLALGNTDLAGCAVRVLATVVSRPAPDRACLDSGSKSLGLDLVPAAAHRAEYPGYGLLVGLDGWQLERLSEEHGWLRWHGPGKPPELRIGQRVQVVPNHVCMAFASLGEVTAVEAGQVVGTWPGLGAGASR